MLREKPKQLITRTVGVDQARLSTVTNVLEKLQEKPRAKLTSPQQTVVAINRRMRINRKLETQKKEPVNPFFALDEKLNTLVESTPRESNLFIALHGMTTDLRTSAVRIRADVATRSLHITDKTEQHTLQSVKTAILQQDTKTTAYNLGMNRVRGPILTYLYSLGSGKDAGMENIEQIAHKIGALKLTIPLKNLFTDESKLHITEHDNSEVEITDCLPTVIDGIGVRFSRISNKGQIISTEMALIATDTQTLDHAIKFADSIAPNSTVAPIIRVPLVRPILERGARNHLPDIRILGRDRSKLLDLLRNPEKGISYNTNSIEDMIWSDDFTVGKPGITSLTIASPKDLGLSPKATTEQIYKKAEEFNLELLPPEAAFSLAIEAKYNPDRFPSIFAEEDLILAMTPLRLAHGWQNIFRLTKEPDGVYLDNMWAPLDYNSWNPKSKFVFSSSFIPRR